LAPLLLRLEVPTARSLDSQRCRVGSPAGRPVVTGYLRRPRRRKAGGSLGSPAGVKPAASGARGGRQRGDGHCRQTRPPTRGPACCVETGGRLYAQGMAAAVCSMRWPSRRGLVGGRLQREPGQSYGLQTCGDERDGFFLTRPRFGQGRVRGLPVAVQRSQIWALLDQYWPDSVHDSVAAPRLEAPMLGADAAEGHRQLVPTAACLRTGNDAVGGLAPVCCRASQCR
jgi:hypothetical protein